MMSCLPNVNQAYALIIQDGSQKGIVGSIHEGMEFLVIYSSKGGRPPLGVGIRHFGSISGFFFIFSVFCSSKL